MAGEEGKGLGLGAPVDDCGGDRPHRSIYVHFECREDMEEFRRVTGLDVTPETRVIWFPEGCVGR